MTILLEMRLLPPFVSALFRGTGPCSPTIGPAAKSVLCSCTHSLLPSIHSWCVSANESVHLWVLKKERKSVGVHLKQTIAPEAACLTAYLETISCFMREKQKTNKHWWWVILYIYICSCSVCFICFFLLQRPGNDTTKVFCQVELEHFYRNDINLR